jgi:hypothetical protein
LIGKRTAFISGIRTAVRILPTQSEGLKTGVFSLLLYKDIMPRVHERGKALSMSSQLFCFRPQLHKYELYGLTKEEIRIVVAAVK